MDNGTKVDRDEAQRIVFDVIRRAPGGDSPSILGITTPGAYKIRFEDRAEITFAILQELADRFGTKLINFIFEEGWAGTDITAGDPAEFEIWITREPE